MSGHDGVAAPDSTARVPPHPDPGGAPADPGPLVATAVIPEVHQAVVEACADNAPSRWGPRLHLMGASAGLLGLAYVLVLTGHAALLTGDVLSWIVIGVVCLGAIHAGMRTLDLRELGRQLASLMPWNRRP